MEEIKDPILEKANVSAREELRFDAPDDVSLRMTSDGPKFQSKKEGNTIEISVNGKHFTTPADAFRFGALKLAQTVQLKRSLRRNVKELLKATSLDSGITRILQLQGLKNIKNSLPELVQRITGVNSADLSLTEAFDYACEHYVLTGEFPENLPQEVAQAIDSIPKIKKGIHKGLHVLDAIVSEKYNHKIEQKLFQDIGRARAELKKKETSATGKFEYRPQVGAGESEPVDPESIETKVTPFYGGYFRGYVCRFDTDKHEIVQEAGHAELFVPEQDINTDKLKKYTYETVYDPTKDNLLEMPYKALPLISTLQPTDFGIYRSDKGSFYLRSKSAIAEGQKKQKISFRFVITETEDNTINDTPDTRNDVWGSLDTDAETFLSSLEGQSLSEIEKAKKCEAYTRKRFKYPADENARAEMNEIYLKAGDQSLKAMCEQKVADCYWSNIFCGQLLARLEVNHRIIAGHYVQKDPRFDFAAVAGIGHAWSEIWDGNSWQRIDATPPKEKKEDEEEKPQDEKLDGDFGENSEPPEPQEELTIEEIQTLFEELIREEIKPISEPSPEKLFERTTGVSLAKWKVVENYVKAINRTTIPAQSSINGKESTIEEQWEKLFELIYKRREIPIESFRGPVRQSEGDELEDPVDAVIDILSGESDPMGYKLRHEKTKERIDVTSFEDDSILDLTASMAGTPAQEQKKMILSGLYNLMMLGRRLDLDKYKRRMREPIALKSRVLTFKGDTQVLEALGSEQMIDEKSLCGLYDELDQTRTGGGNLVGALKAYEEGLDPKKLSRIRAKKLVKVLTIVSDGVVSDTGEAAKIIQSLRSKGIVVQGIGFGNSAQDIRVICHDPEDENAGVVIEDVKKAVSVRHGMLSKSLKNL
ncbi:MAG: hypothetical protein WC285_05320 [Candidatus Gracilibacteria bacterium]|jgi:hypothetical protein